jgi:LuxR family transcriptional regulator, maltose regulon positive regulatory protein
MQKVDPIIRTKLHRPAARPGLVVRDRLQCRMMGGLSGPLTLITAPAGFGKTTLVASCVSESHLPIAWLSLDKNDNQAGRFLNYLVASLQSADLRIGREAAQMLSSSQSAATEVVLTSLINELDDSDVGLVLVLDDYQVISAQAVHEQVVFLLEHCPGTFHLVIATRSDPALPLARWRARGQVVELRTADLRFTEAEATQFLNDIMGLHLADRLIAMLEERTEGWAAGLHMVALALHSHGPTWNEKDTAGFIEGFSGTNRYILDYLLEEVLASQAEEIHQFLLGTSILERLTAPLCDAVLENRQEPGQVGRPGAATEPFSLSPSAAILAYLERANLFLIPLDDERQWYRYHHLFQNLLQQRLKAAQQPEEIVAYHRRAAAWLEANGWISESIQHWLAAGDFEIAADSVEHSLHRLFAQGKLHQLLDWIGILPEAVVAHRPRLILYKAWILAFAGKPRESQQVALSARQAIEAASLSVGETHGLMLELAGIQGLNAISLGDASTALGLADWVKEQDDPDHLFACSVIHWAIGFAHRMQGNLQCSIPEFSRVLQIGEQLENAWTILSGSDDLGTALRLSGRLREAETVYRRGLQLIDQLGSAESGFVGRLELVLANTLYERNALDEARQVATSSIAHNRSWDTPNHTAVGYRALARVFIAQGELEEADLLLQQAEKVLAQAVVVPPVRAYVETMRGRWWLAHGDLAKAEEWAAVHLAAIQSTQKLREDTEIYAIAVAKVFMTAGNPAAWELLNAIEPAARAMGRNNSLIQILVLKSLSAASPAAGLHALEEALGYAQPEGYRRVFLDEGQPMKRLLAQWLAHAKTGLLREFAIHLLAQFGMEQHPLPALETPVFPAENPDRHSFQPGQGHPAAKENQKPGSPLVEPLSQRELEVLHLMALGCTNQEIARQLVVAPGTIKAHAATIYRKLDAANRTEAVARARKSGLIP